MTGDEFNTLAWRDFVMFAWQQDEMRRAFTASTGVTLPSGSRTPIEAMVDEATGAQADALAAFMRWVTVEHWGLEHAPQTYRDEIEALP